MNLVKKKGLFLVKKLEIQNYKWEGFLIQAALLVFE